MSGFDPITGIILHPGNPQPAVEEAVNRLNDGQLVDIKSDLRFNRPSDMTERDAKWRIELVTAAQQRRVRELEECELHRVRASEHNLFADLGDLTTKEEQDKLQSGTIDDVI